MNFASRLWPGHASRPFAVSNAAVVIASTAVVAAAALSLLQRALWPPHPKVIPSPLHTVLPHLSKKDLERLEYKVDAFPGARDVETPVWLLV